MNPIPNDHIEESFFDFSNPAMKILPFKKNK